MLRDKVPEVLRPLCVAVLGSDQDARRQLETSIGAITERLTTETSGSLSAHASTLKQRRKELLTESKVPAARPAGSARERVSRDYGRCQTLHALRRRPLREGAQPSGRLDPRTGEAGCHRCHSRPRRLHGSMR